MFVGELEERYRCPVCCLMLRYPVQFEQCGHRCCTQCWTEIIRVEPRCPYDNIKLDKNRVFADKALQLDLDSLQVLCPHYESGCRWKGRRDNYQDHAENCQYVQVVCPNGCGKSGLTRRDVDDHLSDYCGLRLVRCQFCRQPVTHDDEIEHARTCPEFPVDICPRGCRRKNFTRSTLSYHLENDCPNERIQCPFEHAGCTYKCLRVEMDEHVEQSVASHLALVNSCLLRHRRRRQRRNSSADDVRPHTTSSNN